LALGARAVGMLTSLRQATGRLRVARCVCNPFSQRGFAAAGKAEGEGEPKATHWLSKHFPDQEDWLLKQAEAFFYKGVAQICERDAKLAGNQDFILGELKSKYESLVEKHRGRIVCSRSRTHLQQASLALSTYRTLLPFVGDHARLVELIGKLQGNESNDILGPLQRLAMWMSRDRFGMVSRRLRLLKQDYGEGFEIELGESEGRSVLEVKKCFYEDFFRAEDAPELTASCCCSVDKNWFEGALSDQRGVAFERSSSIAAGDSSCRLIVSKD